MTNEIAIHRLLLVRHRKDCTELLAEALDMAIAALSKSQKQTDSLIRTSADDVSEADVIYRSEPKTADSGSLDSEMPEIKADRTTGVLISRQQALDELDKGAWGVEWDKALAETMLDSLPSAQQWIPVEERLPEDGVYVLICDGEHFKDYDCKNGAYSQIAVGWTEQGEFRCWDDRTHMSKVIAWMELPEPYKKGQ